MGQNSLNLKLLKSIILKYRCLKGGCFTNKRFQQRNMENIMKSMQITRQLNLICHRSHGLHNCQGANPFSCKLPTQSRRQRQVLGVEKDVVTRRKGSMAATLVVVALLVLIRRLNEYLKGLVHISTTPNKLLYWFYTLMLALSEGRVEWEVWRA